MLFLGAGASKALGIGDLKDLTDKVNEEITSKGYGQLLEHLNDALNNANKSFGFFNPGEIDMEVIFSILNARADSANSLKDSGPYAVYINELRAQSELPFSNQLQSNKELDDLKKSIEEIIVSSCNTFDINRAKKYYDELFKLEHDIIEYRTLNGTSNIPIFSPVVTTNYDLVLERYSSKTENKYGKDFLGRGLITEERGNDRYLPLDKVFSEYNDKVIKYLKLHGSIDWWIRDKDKKIVERESPNSLMGEAYKDRLMVYPIYEKYVSKNPFFSLYYYFRKLLYQHYVYVVIGHSFRDPSINNAFSDALKMHPEKRIIIVNPNSKTLEKRINDNFSEMQVDLVDKYFGDDEMIKELQEKLSK